MGRSKPHRSKTGKAQSAPTMVDPEVLKLTPEQVTAFIERMREVVTDEHDFRIIQGSLATLGLMAQELKSKRTSIRRLTSLLFGSSSEAIEKLFPPTTPRPKPKGPRPGHGRTGASSYPGAEHVKVPHEGLKPGDECPECPNGRVYPMTHPAVMVRIVGLSPLQAKVIERERLRCNACGEVFTAKVPEGTGPEKFDASAAAMVALLKYGTGAPFHRLARLQANLGIPLPASTQWELVRKQAGLLDPVMDELARLAAQAEVVFNDDTTMKLIDRPDLRLDRKERKGVYTSGIVARIQVQGRARGIVLFRDRAPPRRGEPGRDPPIPEPGPPAADPDVRRIGGQHERAIRDPGGALPCPRPPAVRGRAGGLPRGMPAPAGGSEGRLPP